MIRAHDAPGVKAMVMPDYPTALKQVPRGHVTESKYTEVEP